MLSDQAGQAHIAKTRRRVVSVMTGRVHSKTRLQALKNYSNFRWRKPFLVLLLLGYTQNLPVAAYF
jgi:hypothetical protein